MKLEPTASQTVGPYLHIGLNWLTTSRIASPNCPGEQMVIRGRVLDADGRGVNDALLELWQADSRGKYVHPDDTRTIPPTGGFRGFGRVPTDGEGQFEFHTIKPGAVPDQEGGMQAPHILVSVFMRGILKQIRTRIYFPGEALNDKDPVLKLVPAERRGTLVARRGAGNVLEWDVNLQGPNETVCFDV
jgi:protocatechuate 3,4-dioxygenase, alpha subunit